MKKALIVLLLVLVSCSSGTQQQNLDSFAKCLSEEGVTMYGAYWCPHCQNNKEAFGDSFQYVNYVECDPRHPTSQSELCVEKGIEGYPTWEFPDGRMMSGEINPERLASLTQCSIGE